MSQFAPLLEPPYYAVVFASTRTPDDREGYDSTSERMVELASTQPGFLGIESTRGSDGFGITVSYWSSLEAIEAWHQHAEHKIAQSLGRSRWYEQFSLRICKVEQAFGFARNP